LDKLIIKSSDTKGKLGSEVLEPLLKLLIENGNSLATSYRWSSNPTGYVALLTKPIDFELFTMYVEKPKSIVFNQKYGEIDYGLGTAIIRSV